MGKCWCLSHHQKDSPVFPWWVSVHLISFFQRSHEIATLLEKRRKLCRYVPISCTPSGTDNARGAVAAQTGNDSTLLPSSCRPGAGERLCRLLPGLRVYLPLWNNAEKPKQEPRKGSSAATLVSSPPEHLGLAVLLSGPLLPPWRGTTLSCVPCTATAAVQLSCALYYLEQFSSAVPKAGARALLGFQGRWELSVSVGKCRGLLLCWTMSTQTQLPELLWLWK